MSITPHPKLVKGINKFIELTHCDARVYYSEAGDTALIHTDAKNPEGESVEVFVFTLHEGGDELSFHPCVVDDVDPWVGSYRLSEIKSGFDVI